MKRIIILLELGLFLMSISLFSQSYLINNDYCIVSDNAYLIVNGYINNQSSGNLLLTGTNSNVIVQNNITNNGNINSSGIIELYGDWINHLTYTHNNTSYVYLKGGNQSVGGSATTTFYNLYLQGSGIKTLGNNEFVDGTLNLHDRELATEHYTMTVNNPAVGAIQRTTGFVSSTVGGGLARATNSASAYLFPVGVSGKYRPADVAPSSTTASIYKVRMADGDASSEGYNRNNKATDICEVNPSFFHIMQQTSGTSNNANIKVYYDNTIDGSWDKVGYWTTLWNNYTGSSTNIGTPLYYGSVNNVSLSSSTPIALTKNAPVLSVSASPNPICSGQSTVLTASGASTYSWSGGLGTGASKTVTPSSTTTYTVTGTTAGCTGTAEVTVTVNPLPSTPTYTIDCTGGENYGIITVTSPLGLDYEYSIGGPYQSNPQFNSLANGPYTITVMNINTSCIASTLPINLNCGCSDPPTLTLSSTSGNTCLYTPYTVNGNTFSGSTTQVTLSHDGDGNLNNTTFTSSPFSFTYTPAPSDAGHDVTITITTNNPLGSPCVTSEATFVLTINPLPTVTVSASPTSVCYGESSTLSAGGASTYTWSHSLGSGSSKTVTPSSTTTYTVTGTSAAGCTNTASVTVTVNSIPTVTASAAPPSICEGETSTLSAGGASTYSWSGGGSTASITVTPSSTTTYTVTGTTAGCTGTATISVTVNPLPTVTAFANPSNICIGGNSVLSASGGNTYNWSNGMSGASITVAPSSTSTYTVTGISSAGCANTATVTVNVSTTIDIIANANPSSICEGAYSILSASGGDIYNWSNSMSGATITVTPTNTTTYTVTGSSGGCSGTATVSVTVNPLPTVIASADPTSICEGETSTLTADGASTYSWSHSLGSGSSKTVAPSITTIYSVTGTSTAGCTNTASVTVTVNLLPTVTASADPTSICEGEISTLTAGGASNYSWSHSLGSGAIKTVTPNSTTTYTVTGTNTEGCTGTTTVSVTVNPNADATINPVGNLCDNQSLIILTAATPGGLWSGEGITIPSTGAFSPANVGTGTYTITYMISGQCGDTATIDITVYSSPEVTAYATDESCFNGNDGQAWVEVTNGTPPYTYLWNTYHTISNLNDLAPGVYHVTVTDTHNCSDRDTVIINPGIGDCYQTHIYVPNIFAPDGKGNAENEYLRVYGKGIKDLDFKIFDRWGNEVFHTTDINVGWDGTYKGQPALAGDYTYMLRVTYYNGNNESLKGHIYLIR